LTKLRGEFSPATPLSPEEPLARYVMDARRIDWANRLVKEQQFYPDKARNEVSTFRVQSMSRSEISALGVSEVASKREPPLTLLGWGRFNVSIVKRASEALFIDTTDDPEDPMHPRHAAIRGWPDDDDPETRKGRMKLIAQFFSDNATLELTDEGDKIAARK